jgi:23S rRNA (guanosine2251-2'-O)-methyltransferase
MRQRKIVQEIVFGVNPVREHLRAAPGSIRALLAVPNARAVQELVAEARAQGIAVEPTDQTTLDRLTGRGHHQGVAARTTPFAYADAGRLLASGAALLVAADGITDPQNLGAIVRSAEVLGAGGLLIPRDRSAPVTPAVIRAASGATTHLPIASVVNLARALADAKEHGYWIAALDPSGDGQLSDPPSFDRVVLVVGSEGAGVRRLVLEQADVRLAIPVRGRVASLNASAAAAIALFVLGERVFAARKGTGDSARRPS